MADYGEAHAVQVAHNMMRRYSTAKVAREMAHWHAMDYPRDSEQRRYWEYVYTLIVSFSGEK